MSRTLNESIVEAAALEWFGEQTRYARTLTPALSHGEREEDSEVVLVGRLREAIRRLNPAIPEEASACALHADRRAVIKRYLKARFVRRLNP